jgi:hypothetical protein
MKNILEIWEESPELFKSKSLSQILNFIGDGKLRDKSNTSEEFRELLKIIPTEIIKKFIDDCLSEKFENSGFALQDIINQIGQRLGFIIENGLYKGKKDSIGYDGIWTFKDNYSFIVEVKTTDAYRINLDTIAEYRKKLIESNKILKEKSSILIIVGRQDTGDLEAQIRGSKHAWDIRLLSSDSVLKLLVLKESLNDTKTIQQINEILKPNEYTRIDKLIELIFLTSQDIQINNDQENNIEENTDLQMNENIKQEKVNFNDKCIIKIQKHLNKKLIKESRTAFSDKDKKIGVIGIVSKKYIRNNDERYWYGFYPYYIDFLKNYKNAFISFGCGSEDIIFLIPLDAFEPLLPNMNTTIKENGMYWHVEIKNIDNNYYILQPLLKNSTKIDITKYKIQ